MLDQMMIKPCCNILLLQADMLNLTSTFKPASFDCVLDKGAMDALVTDEGDPWDPNTASGRGSS